jgi:peptidoglycan hydrolase CwlO-like protein
MEERLKNLEKENTETTNVLYELQNQIDSLNERLKIIENYILSDGK